MPRDDMHVNPMDLSDTSSDDDEDAAAGAQPAPAPAPAQPRSPAAPKRGSGQSSRASSGSMQHMNPMNMKDSSDESSSDDEEKAGTGTLFEDDGAGKVGVSNSANALQRLQRKLGEITPFHMIGGACVLLVLIIAVVIFSADDEQAAPPPPPAQTAASASAYQVSGKAFAGSPYEGCTVCLDQNANGACDGEPRGTTGRDGSYTIPLAQPAADDDLVIMAATAGCTDAVTGDDIIAPLSTTAGATVMSPMTTLKKMLMDGGMDGKAADDALKSAFLLPSSTDISSADFSSECDADAGCLKVLVATAEVSRTAQAVCVACQGGSGEKGEAYVKTLRAIAETLAANAAEEGVPQAGAGGPSFTLAQTAVVRPIMDTVCDLTGSQLSEEARSSIARGIARNNNEIYASSDSVQTVRFFMRSDACGELFGDGSSCAGCDGQPNSGAQLNPCGECSRDDCTDACGLLLVADRSDPRYREGYAPGSSCAGCDGAANSGKELDPCGVCDGDGSSCAGCDGEPNSGASFDECGVCGGDSTTCCLPDGRGTCDAAVAPDAVAGCDGIAGSNAVSDACGLCGGDGTSCVPVVVEMTTDSRITASSMPPLSPERAQFASELAAELADGLNAADDSRFTLLTVWAATRGGTVIRIKIMPAAEEGAATPQELQQELRMKILVGALSQDSILHTVMRSPGVAVVPLCDDGLTVADACGECGGDGSACAGCDGVPLSARVVDQCGECGGDNTACKDQCGVVNGDDSSCAGCDGRPNSGAAFDQCGVCAGDSSCLDLCGVVNGDNTTCVDQCGVPNGDGTRCADCLGVPNGDAIEDECGECNGDSSCLDACGVPNGDDSSCGGVGCDGEVGSGLVVDDCDVCGGDGTSCRDVCGVIRGDNSSCAGCDGIPNSLLTRDACGWCGGTNASCVMGCDNTLNSGAEFDACGVCDGDGSSCLGCDGVSFSGLSIDECGECGGDGVACPEGPCSHIQRETFASCVSGCNHCDKEAASALLLDCEINETRAVSMIGDRCTGEACSAAQEDAAASCVSNCLACNQATTASGLESCVLDDTVASFTVRDTCTAAQTAVMATAAPCSALQLSRKTECTGDCSACDAESVRAILGDCVLDSGAAARDELCSSPVVSNLNEACSTLQLSVIRQCSDNCIDCHVDDVATILLDCTVSGVQQRYGETFCDIGAAAECTPAQHDSLVACLSNCASCDQDSATELLGDCVTDTDTGAGTRAADLVQTRCASGQLCTNSQQTVAARCLQNCDACDQENARMVLGACTLDGHGAAVHTLETCNARNPPAVAETGSSHAEPPPPPPAPVCSLLQNSVMGRCADDCDSCDVDTIKTIVANCVTAEGNLARETLCTHIEQTESLRTCSALQLAVITQCATDCAGCDFASTNIILAGCTLDEVAQVAGSDGTVCRSGAACSALQHQRLVDCIQLCDACDTEDTISQLGDCVVDVDRVEGGVRAVEQIATLCNLGVACTPIQETAIARCLRDCSACNRVATGQLVGSCTSDGGSAATLIAAHCDAPPPPPPPLPALDAASPSSPTPSPTAPSCSTLQSGLYRQCIENCAGCRLESVLVVLGACTNELGDPARDELLAACGDSVAPTPAPSTGPQQCTAVQERMVDDCTEDCLGCSTEDTNRALAGCVSADGTTPQALSCRL